MARRERSNDPESPWGLVFTGAIVAVLGAGVFSSDPGLRWAGLALLWLGGVLTTAGAVGIGVTLGVLRADFIRDRDRERQSDR